MKLYDKDPKKGGKEISEWEFMEQSGMIDRLKQKGIIINPTHSFDLLKQTRLKLFEKDKQGFIKERKLKKLETSDFEIKCMYYSWLKGELTVIENALSNSYRTTSDHIEILKYKQFVDDEMIQTEKEINPPQHTETKTDKLKAELSKYGFFELSKVKQVSEPNKQALIELISTNDLPYSIAMFEYLGFLKHLKSEHFTTDYKLFKAVAKWFDVAKRAVKGNIYVLNEFSKENRTRYTAHQHKQTVQKNYEKLK